MVWNDLLSSRILLTVHLQDGLLQALCLCTDMTDFTIPEVASFVSPSNPSHKIQYSQLNSGAPQTLLFCYGAGDCAVTITLYQEFIRTHPQLSMVCIDRWTLPTSSDAAVARSGLELLSELTSITVELLDSLTVQNFSIAAHSAGVYPMIHLADSVPARVNHLFPICTHVPPPFSASKVLSWMCTMPTLLFNGITKLDSGGDTDSTIDSLKNYVLGSRGSGQHGRDRFVDTLALQELLKQYRPGPEQSAAAKERQSLDYQLVYSRLPGIDNKALADIYMSLREHSIPVTWFTSHGDAFFGPPSVERLIDATGIQKGIEVVIVEGAKHSDIHFRREVWDEMHRRMVAVE